MDSEVKSVDSEEKKCGFVKKNSHFVYCLLPKVWFKISSKICCQCPIDGFVAVVCRSKDFSAFFENLSLSNTKHLCFSACVCTFVHL